jgi:hypothetical protein
MYLLTKVKIKIEILTIVNHLGCDIMGEGGKAKVGCKTFYQLYPRFLYFTIYFIRTHGN